MDRDGESTPRVVQSFVEAVPTPAVACDPETHAIRAANAAAAALLGQDRRTLTLMGLTDLGEADETVDGEPVAAAADEAIDREELPSSSGRPVGSGSGAGSRFPSTRRRSPTSGG